MGLFEDLFPNKKRKSVSLKEYNEMKRFLVAQVAERDKRIEKLKEEKQIILNMAIRKSNQEKK